MFYLFLTIYTSTTTQFMFKIYATSIE